MISLISPSPKVIPIDAGKLHLTRDKALLVTLIKCGSNPAHTPLRINKSEPDYKRLCEVDSPHRAQGKYSKRFGPCFSFLARLIGVKPKKSGGLDAATAASDRAAGCKWVQKLGYHVTADEKNLLARGVPHSAAQGFYVAPTVSKALAQTESGHTVLEAWAVMDEQKVNPNEMQRAANGGLLINQDAYRRIFFKKPHRVKISDTLTLYQSR